MLDLLRQGPECSDCTDTGIVEGWFCSCPRGWKLFGETKPTAPKEIHTHDIKVNHEKCGECGLWPHRSSCDGEHYVNARRIDAVLTAMEKEAEAAPEGRRYAHLETLDVIRTRILGEGCDKSGVSIEGPNCVSWE